MNKYKVTINHLDEAGRVTGTDIKVANAASPAEAERMARQVWKLGGTREASIKVELLLKGVE